MLLSTLLLPMALPCCHSFVCLSLGGCQLSDPAFNVCLMVRKPIPAAPGLQAIAEVAASIKAGFYTIGIAGGVESMTTNPMAWEGAINPKVADNQCAQDCLLPMGEHIAADLCCMA